MTFGVFLLLGGIGMFLYGINMMSRGLEQVSSGRLRQVLAAATHNRYLSMLTGTGITVVIQSSGAVNVMTIGFINAGLLSLSQALYIMLGANIGTTITAQIIAFDVDIVAPLILFIGVAAHQFIKNETAKRVGFIILGFGILFTGIYIMGEAVDSLSLSSVVTTFLDRYNNPILSLIFGAAFTAMIQSSSASIGILQVLAMQTFGVSIGLSSVIYMIIGMNIGACTPVLLASIGGSYESKRAAYACLIEKLLGAGIFIIIIKILPQTIALIEQLAPDDVSRQIANLHLIFNLTASLCLFPLVPSITRFILRVIPECENGVRAKRVFNPINPDILLAPSGVAVIKTKAEILRMYRMAISNLSLSIESFFDRDEVKAQRVFDIENDVDLFCSELAKFLVTLSAQKLSLDETQQVGIMFQIINDIERVSDHAENIAEYARIIIKENISLSDQALKGLRSISDAALAALEVSFLRYQNGDDSPTVEQVEEYEQRVDALKNELILNHIDRLKQSACNPRSGVIFTDMVSDLERCADHAYNIAQVSRIS